MLLVVDLRGDRENSEFTRDTKDSLRSNIKPHLQWFFRRTKEVKKFVVLSLQAAGQAEDADVWLAPFPGQHAQLTARDERQLDHLAGKEAGNKAAVDHFVCGNMNDFGYTQEQVSILDIILFPWQYFPVKY